MVKKGRLLTGWSGSSQLHTSALVVVPSVAAYVCASPVEMALPFRAFRYL